MEKIMFIESAMTVDGIKEAILEIEDYFGPLQDDGRAMAEGAWFDDQHLGDLRKYLLEELFNRSGEWICDGEFYQTNMKGK
jgi:hypothetical protein